MQTTSDTTILTTEKSSELYRTDAYLTMPTIAELKRSADERGIDRHALIRQILENYCRTGV